MVRDPIYVSFLTPQFIFTSRAGVPVIFEHPLFVCNLFILFMYILIYGTTYVSFLSYDDLYFIVFRGLNLMSTQRDSFLLISFIIRSVSLVVDTIGSPPSSEPTHSLAFSHVHSASSTPTTPTVLLHPSLLGPFQSSR